MIIIEPTTGLDNETALAVMTWVKQLTIHSSRPVTVICSIHQPSQEVAFLSFFFFFLLFSSFFSLFSSFFFFFLSFFILVFYVLFSRTVYADVCVCGFVVYVDTLLCSNFVVTSFYLGLTLNKIFALFDHLLLLTQGSLGIALVSYLFHIYSDMTISHWSVLVYNGTALGAATRLVKELSQEGHRRMDESTDAEFLRKYSYSNFSCVVFCRSL